MKLATINELTSKTEKYFSNVSNYMCFVHFFDSNDELIDIIKVEPVFEGLPILTIPIPNYVERISVLY